MKQVRWTAALAVTVGALWVAGADPARASCHAFSVSASPATVTEGGSVTVTVSRDGAAAPSAVRVSTSNGSATAGSDYQGVDRTVSFSSGTSQSFSISTFSDTAAEAGETFSIRLSEPVDGGCDGDHLPEEFSFGGPATVTIADKAPPPPPTTAKPTAAPTTARATTATTKKGATTTTTGRGATTTTAVVAAAATTATSEVATTTTTTRAAAGLVTISKEDDGGMQDVVIVGGVLLVTVIAVFASLRNPVT